MAARTGSTPRPSTQTPAAPTLTEEMRRGIGALPRQMRPIRLAPASGEIWLQCEASGDGWIRARVVEAGPGYLGVVAARTPALGRGTWGRIGVAEGPNGDAGEEQVRVYPVAAHALGASGTPLFVECEIPVDESLIARFLRSA